MTREYSIEGIMCNKCVNHITEVISSINGIGEFTVQRDAPQLTVEFLDPNDSDGIQAELIGAIEGIGYPISPL